MNNIKTLSQRSRRSRMDYKTHKFDDDLGGTFKYMDEPGRLDDLLAKDARRYRKPKLTQGEINIKAQVKWYVDHVVKNNIKTLVFYPLKASMNSLTNQFQYLVLKELHLPYHYRNSQISELRNLHRLAMQNGYILIEHEDVTVTANG